MLSCIIVYELSLVYASLCILVNSKQIQDSWQTKVLEWEIAPVGGYSWAARLHGACWEGSLRLEGLASLLWKSIKALVVLAVTLVVEVEGKRGAKGTDRNKA